MKTQILVALALAAVLLVVAFLTLRPQDPSPSQGPATGESPSAAASGATHVLVGAGDIAECEGSGDEATAALLDEIDGTVFTLGDNAYPDGELEDFEECYDPSWGRHRERTRPAPGNHEYFTEDAEGYFEYFGAAAGDGYYAYDLGEWRIYSLNSEEVSEEQLDWLTADLVAHPRDCILAYWHHPRYSSSSHGGTRDVAPFWRALYLAGAEVVINGHEHNYERFAPLDLEGFPADTGLRMFIVGTGGGLLSDHVERQPNSEAQWSDGHGVLKFELAPTGYSWEFVSVPGEPFSDSGSASCH